MGQAHAMTPLSPPPPAKKSGLATVVLGVIGLCCFPFGIVAFVLGFLDFRRAKRDGHATPGSALAGMVLGVLSLFFFGGFALLGVKLKAERDAASSALQAKLEGKRDGASLDAETACDVSREFLISERQQAPDAIACSGPPLGDTVLTQPMTRGYDKEPFTLCLAKAHRWFVFAEPADDECPKAGPQVSSKAPANEQALRDEEKALRDAEATRRAAAVAQDFDRRRRALVQALDEHQPGTVGACGELPDLAKKPLRFVDHSQLRKRQDDDWDFMTHREFRAALDGSRDGKDRAEDIGKLLRSGPVFVVFQEDAPKRWPEVHGSSDYTSGDYAGWVRLVDFKAGRVLCEAPLAFYNSSTVSSLRLTKLESREHALETAVEKDFEINWKQQAEAAVGGMSTQKLELATSVFD